MQAFEARPGERVRHGAATEIRQIHHDSPPQITQTPIIRLLICMYFKGIATNSITGERERPAEGAG